MRLRDLVDLLETDTDHSLMGPVLYYHFKLHEFRANHLELTAALDVATEAMERTFAVWTEMAAYGWYGSGNGVVNRYREGVKIGARLAAMLCKLGGGFDGGGVGQSRCSEDEIGDQSTPQKGYLLRGLSTAEKTLVLLSGRNFTVSAEFQTAITQQSVLEAETDLSQLSSLVDTLLVAGLCASGLGRVAVSVEFANYARHIVETFQSKATINTASGVNVVTQVQLEDWQQVLMRLQWQIQKHTTACGTATSGDNVMTDDVGTRSATLSLNGTYDEKKKTRRVTRARRKKPRR
jgi:hypothetical protein